MFHRFEQMVLVILAFLVLSGAGFRLWMREGDIIVEVVEKESEPPIVVSSEVHQEQEQSVLAPTTLGDTEVDQLAARKVNVNTASLAELDSLPGIGPALAQRIIEERIAFGKFESVDDLARVKGIGTGTIDRLRPFVVTE